MAVTATTAAKRVTSVGQARGHLDVPAHQSPDRDELATHPGGGGDLVQHGERHEGHALRRARPRHAPSTPGAPGRRSGPRRPPSGLPHAASGKEPHGASAAEVRSPPDAGLELQRRRESPRWLPDLPRA
mgnify:CR=1 FL=1